MNESSDELAKLRVLLVHEWLYTWAGAERVLEQMVALMPHADVLAGIVTPDMRRRHEIARRARETWVGQIPGSRRAHRWFLPLHALAFSQFDTSGYDLVISISHAFEKAIRATKPGARHVSYCLTPPRYIWDLGDSHDALATPAQGLALRAARPVLRALDKSLADGVHQFVSLSRVVADRVGRCYDQPSAVVYPPVAVKAPHQAGKRRERFLLTIGRLVPYKRVDLAIRAAERLGIRLVVVGEGPERARLERMAGTWTEMRGEVSEEDAAELLSTCAAFVFCAEEDFGIAPVEANAHGAPVVAFGRGGATETMSDGISAVFFHEQTVDAVCAAIQGAMSREWDEPVLQANAARFSTEAFRDGMRRELTRAIASGAGA